MAGMDPIGFLSLDDPIQSIVAQAVSQRAAQIRQMERSDLAARIADEVWKALG